MKPAILLYNTPATLNEEKWTRPIPLNLLRASNIMSNLTNGSSRF
jgi:hypothetical protein